MLKKFDTVFEEMCPQEYVDEFLLNVIHEYLNNWSSFFKYCRKFYKKEENFTIEITNQSNAKNITINEFKQVLIENIFGLLFNRVIIDTKLFIEAETH